MPTVLEGHLVASFRVAGGSGRSFVERARPLIARLVPLGAVHVGWAALEVTFAFEDSKLDAVLAAAATPGPETLGEEPAWAVGIAQGDIRAVKEDGSDLTRSGLLWWGPPIVEASSLARLARAGEILCADTVSALRAGELVTSGVRIARDGALRVRGARVDRRQPWRKTAANNVGRMVEPRFFHAHLPVVMPQPGALVVVRADPGAGGTRVLREVAARAPRALVISPVGSGFEPLGALRRALGRSLGRELSPLLLELGAPLEALLAGNVTSLDMAARLVTAVLWPKQSGTKSALVIDDAKAVDPATLEACVRAVRQSTSIGLVARLDATSALPSVLALLPKAAEHELPLLPREGAEDVAASVTGGALDAVARRRWARLGGGSPLATVEAVTLAIARGDIMWSGAIASARSRAAGRGKVEPAAAWIRERASVESMPARTLLSLLAVIGGEAKVGFLSRVLERAGLRVDVTGTVAQLVRSRWLVVREPPSGGGERSVAFPSRTHQKALADTFVDGARKKLHIAIARVIEEEEGAFGRVEGAWHAAQAGEGARAAAALLDAARATAEARLEASCTQLIAFARRADPSCEEAALELLANALERAPSLAPPPLTMAPSTTPEALSVSTAHASITALPPRTGGTRMPVLAAPPSRRTASVAPPQPPDADEPDSMVERALIVPPDGPGPAAPRPTLELATDGPASERPSVIEGGEPADSEPPTMMDHEVAHEPPESTLASKLGPSREGGREVDPSQLVRESGVGPASTPPPSAPGSQIAIRFGELAKEALLAADSVALERWVDGLRATGESPAFTERMRAMARLGRGDIGDALRVLRRSRSKLGPQDHRRRCQTSLALGVALSVAGRPQEALLEGMDALARARQTGDERGAKACLAFLAKLYTSVSREAEAERLRGGT
ncbi:MAG: hypothetical protein J0I07_22490 [Myxococcales bacterium]|nr:hypothetical protein [Myxococcales bacterium]